MRRGDKGKLRQGDRRKLGRDDRGILRLVDKEILRRGDGGNWDGVVGGNWDADQHSPEFLKTGHTPNIFHRPWKISLKIVFIPEFASIHFQSPS